MQKLLAMILAGGRGKRMDILCHDRPKPVLPFAGRFRVIDFSLSNCIHSQIYSVAVLVDYQRSYITNYLRRWNRINSAGGSYHILEPKTSYYKGTADAVYQNLDYLQRRADRILVLAGDHVYKMDYLKMLAFHEQVNADVTVGVIQIPVEYTQRFGTVNVDAEGRIINFVEKSRTPLSNLASMGIYIFNADVLTERLIEDASQPNSPHDFGYAILPGMVKRDRVFAFKFESYWQDIGTIEAYYKANMELTRDTPSFSLNGRWPVLTDDNRILQPKTSPHGSVINSIVSPSCVVKGRVENSILSPGVYVEEHAEVRNSVLLANTFIGYHSVIERSILGEEVNVGKSCYVGFNARGFLNHSDITVLGKAVDVPPYTAIGSNCKVLPYVGQAELTTNLVASGTLVSPHT